MQNLMMKTLSRVLFLSWIGFSFIFGMAYAERDRAFTGSDLYGRHIRALSMGNAFTAVAKTGETALFYNPAGLATTFPNVDEWQVAFGVNVDAAVALPTRDLIEDLEDIEGSSDAEEINNFVDQNDDDLHFIGAQVSAYGFYQQQKPFALSWLDRIGVAGQTYTTLQTLLSFPKIGSSSIDIEGQDADSITDQIDTILQNDFNVELSDSEIQQLNQEIANLLANEEDLSDEQEIVNNAIQRGVDAELLLLQMNSTGLGIATLEDRVKIGLNFKSYSATIHQLDNYPVAQAIAEDFDIEDAAPEEKADAVGVDIGGLFTFQGFLADWNPQIGLVWQDIGGVDFGDDVNVEIVETVNIGASVTREFGPALLLVATDIKDITGNYFQKDAAGDKHGRTFTQRFHLGAEVGLWEAADLENRYLYIRSGINQGQFTFGVEGSTPWNILRVGYARYGVDLGNEDESEIQTHEMVYFSLGAVI